MPQSHPSQLCIMSCLAMQPTHAPLLVMLPMQQCPRSCDMHAQPVPTKALSCSGADQSMLRLAEVREGAWRKLRAWQARRDALARAAAAKRERLMQRLDAQLREALTRADAGAAELAQLLGEVERQMAACLGALKGCWSLLLFGPLGAWGHAGTVIQLLYEQHHGRQHACLVCCTSISMHSAKSDSGACWGGAGALQGKWQRQGGMLAQLAAQGAAAGVHPGLQVTAAAPDQPGVPVRSAAGLGPGRRDRGRWAAGRAVCAAAGAVQQRRRQWQLHAGAAGGRRRGLAAW